MSDIPIVICNFNRIDCLAKQVECFKKRGWNNITILDMSSTWKPLLDWYGSCGCRVVTLPNEGPYYWWKTEEYERVKGNYYIYTDSDIVLPDTCPSNILEKYIAVLEGLAGSRWGKIGPILRTHDIPDSFPCKYEAIRSIGIFSNRSIFEYVAPNVHTGMIDTTFAMYAPGKNFDTASPFPHFSPCICLVSEVPYEAIHLPWYVDYSNLSDEDRNYLGTAGVWSMNKRNVQETGKGVA